MSKGKLYLVPTPIGNLKDITLRALEVLKSVDEIAAEDTRQSLKLLNHFEIKKPLFSYHQHNEQGKSEQIVSKCIENNIDFEVLPGATAFTTALVYSGLDTTRFVFRGFIPRETKDRKVLVEEIKDKKETLIFYESPHRLLDTLSFLKNSLGNRSIAVCRELTKLHEDIFRGTLEDAYNNFLENKPRGEFVLVLAGKSESEIKAELEEEFSALTVEEHLKDLINKGMDKKEAIKTVAKMRNIPKKEVYKSAIDL